MTLYTLYAPEHAKSRQELNIQGDSEQTSEHNTSFTPVLSEIHTNLTSIIENEVLTPIFWKGKLMKKITKLPDCVNTTDYQLGSRMCRIPFFNTYNLTTPVNSNPKRVMIFARWRSGSTFTSQLLNRHPDAFHLFEPLTAAGIKAKSQNSEKSKYHEEYLNDYYFRCKMPMNPRGVKQCTKFGMCFLFQDAVLLRPPFCKTPEDFSENYSIF